MSNSVQRGMEGSVNMEPEGTSNLTMETQPVLLEELMIFKQHTELVYFWLFVPLYIIT